LIEELNTRGIAARNEQLRQDLTAEPAAAVILNLVWVLADDRRSAAYEHLTRLVTRNSLTEEMALRSARAMSSFLATKREQLREGAAARSDPAEWEKVITEFLDLVTRPVLHALSPEYQRGKRLDQLIEQTIAAFQEELDKDGDPVASLLRLSEEDSVRILTIHKCKGLEFEKVVVFGVESQFFWGSTIETYRSEFFVAISRAKVELILTWSQRRSRPTGAHYRWQELRQPMHEFLSYADE
jgi:superfamily I DNA/RNA helicase